MYTTTEGDKIYFNIISYKFSEPTCNIAYSQLLPLSQSCTDRPHFFQVPLPRGFEGLPLLCRLPTSTGRLSLQLSYFGVVAVRQILSDGPDKP